MTKQRTFDFILRRFRPRVAVRAGDDPAEADIAGKIMGVACSYNTPDFFGTMFAPGCFDRTRAEKIPQGKVQLFRDHDHTSRSHVGVVRDCSDVGQSVMMSADCFANDEGQQALDYCKSVLAAEGFTGLSVGVYVRSAEYRPNPMADRDGGDKGNGVGNGDESPNTVSPRDAGDQPDSIYTFTEVELAEISITPLPAVPGAEVLHARTRPEDVVRTQLVALRTLMTAIPRAELEAVAKEFGLGVLITPNPAPQDRDANGHPPTDSDVRSAAEALTHVSLEDRLAYMRQTYGRSLGI